MLINVKSLIMMSKGEQSVLGDVAWSVDSIVGDSLWWSNKRWVSKVLNLDILFDVVLLWAITAALALKSYWGAYLLQSFWIFRTQRATWRCTFSKYCWTFKRVADSRGMLHYGTNHCKIGRCLDNYVTDCSNRITQVIVVLEYIELFLRRANLDSHLIYRYSRCF